MDDEPASVWIVVQEGRPENHVLGVFGTSGEADAYMESLATRFPDDIFSYGEYAIGWHRG